MRKATSTIALLAAWIWAFQGCDLKKEKSGNTQKAQVVKTIDDSSQLNVNLLTHQHH